MRWLDQTGALIRTDTIYGDPANGTAVRDRTQELTAPATARRAVLRFNADLDQTAITFSVAAPGVERISDVVNKARAELLALSDVSADSSAALVLDYLGLKGEVNDPVSGLVNAWGTLEDLRGLSVGTEHAFGQFVRQVTAQVGGDGPNLIADNRISDVTLWTLGTGWALNDNSPYGDFASVGHLNYNANAGAGLGPAADSWVFPVQQLQSYACGLQTQSGAPHKVRAEIYWRDGQGGDISHDTISNTQTSASGVQSLARELTAPVHAKRALVRVRINRDASAANVHIGGLSVERIGSTLAKTRGRVDDIVNFNLDGTSALFTKLSGVTTEVFGPGGITGLKASSALHQSSIDGIKAGFSLRTNNNGHISGISATSDLADGVNARSDLLFAADRVHFMGETYGVGTVNVQNGSKDVTGTSTSWLGKIGSGDWFTGPDGRTYKINTLNGNGALTLESNYKGQTDTNEAYDIAPANPLMTVYSEDIVEDGVTIPKGVYINRAMIRKANIWDLIIQDKAQSSNYAEDANGLPLTGWQLKKNGTLKTAGVVISRQMTLAEGSFVYSGAIASGGSVDLNWVNPASATGAGTGSLWRAKADVYNAFAWSSVPNWNAAKGLQHAWSRDPATLISPPWATGTGQRILMDINLRTSLIGINGPITIHWKLKEVT